MGEVIGFEKMKAKLLKISKNDIPKENVLYQLTGDNDDKCIENGNSWEESKVEIDDLNKKDKE
tara:strand:+ start:268 stop:456 length:189 start_codon:yes stop_codon:yes gene_type:complete